MRFIDELEGLVSSQIEMIKTFISMTKLEARLARLSVFPLIVNVFLLLLSLTSIWFTGMAMLGFVLMQAFDSVLITLSCILLCNGVLLGVLLSYLSFNLKNMSFSKTRAYLSGREPNESKKTGADCNNQSGKTIMDPTDATE